MNLYLCVLIHSFASQAMVRLLHDKYKAVTRLSLTGRYSHRPASMGGDILTAMLRNRSQAAGSTSSPPPLLVPQYSLCRLPSIISSKSHDKPGGELLNLSSGPGSWKDSYKSGDLQVFSLNEKSKSSVTDSSAPTTRSESPGQLHEFGAGRRGVEAMSHSAVCPAQGVGKRS